MIKSNKKEMVKETLATVKKWLNKEYQTRKKKGELKEYDIARNKECPIKCLQISIIKKRIQIDVFGRPTKIMNWRRQEAARLQENELSRSEMKDPQRALYKVMEKIVKHEEQKNGS